MNVFIVPYNQEARMFGVSNYVVPGLATVTIDTVLDDKPLLTIILDPSYVGDLNDLEQSNGYPEGVYLSCDSTSCINNPLLAKFMEVLTQWDHDHNGVFDGDVIADAIEDAMWLSREKPNEFHRPSQGFYTSLLMRCMPPAPQRHIVFSFGELRTRFKLRDYLIAIPTILAVIGLIQLQIHLLPVMKYSVVSGIMAAATGLGLNAWVTYGVMVAAIYLLLKLSGRSSKTTPSATNQSPHTYGFFNKAAVYEEQAFREGAENWSWSQRVASCIIFGAIHMTNLIYPLATILPLAIGGAVFMAVYLRVYRQTNFRRSAVLQAAIAHRVYNRIALIAFAISMIYIFGAAAFALFGVGAILMFATVKNFQPAQYEFSAKGHVPSSTTID